MRRLLETTVLIRLTDNGFAVTTKVHGEPDSYLEYETTATVPVASQPVDARAAEEGD